MHAERVFCLCSELILSISYVCWAIIIAEITRSLYYAHNHIMGGGGGGGGMSFCQELHMLRSVRATTTPASGPEKRCFYYCCVCFANALL